MGANKSSKAWVGWVISGAIVIGAIGNALPNYDGIVNQTNNEDYTNAYVSNVANNEEIEAKYNEIIGVNDTKSITLSEIPAYSGSPYVEINNNTPFFESYDLTTSSYEKYSSLDSLRKMRSSYCMYWNRSNANRRKRRNRKYKTNGMAYR